MSGKLYGIGVGPGDPELLTIKAKKILEEADIILTPQSKKSGKSLALSIIEKIVDYSGNIEKLYFPMTYQQSKLEEARDKAANQIIKHINQNRKLAFITIGDPMFYSTYQYIFQRLKEDGFKDSINTIPGITSINASTSRVNIPLAQENEKIAIVSDINNKEEFENILNQFDTTVVMKLSKNYSKAIDILREERLLNNSVLISRCGQKEEDIIYDLSKLEDETINYLSLLIIKQDKQTVELG